MLPCQCWMCRRNRLEERMALELKGLKGKAVKAAANIDRLNAAYDKFNTDAATHAADVEGLAPQIEALAEDLSFSAQTLGNSVNGSADLQRQPVVSQNGQGAVQQPETPPNAQGGSGANPEGQFRG